ncbi:MAG: hypothetical protein IJ796_05465 [Lachnospiraceae bacterium]|nr:hypothetical protein [Lachnospiraceae bacterium]
MYKKQMLLQKIICFVTVITGAVTFLYSLGLMTDLYDTLFTTMPYADHTKSDVAGSIIYYDMQGFNSMLVKVSIGMILVAAVLFITSTNTRRRYYVSNYIAIFLNVAYGLVFTCWAHIKLEAFKAQFKQIDFEALKAYSEMWNTKYSESTFWFDIHYAVFGLVLIVVGLNIFNLIWKINLMKEEKGLIGAGKEIA